MWCNKHLRHTTTEKYDDNGKGLFDYDNNMSYRYILSITLTEMGQLNTYNPIYCNENKMKFRSNDIFMTEKFCTLIKVLLKFVPKGPIDNNPALV